jgi:hypothetical protein
VMGPSAGDIPQECHHGHPPGATSGRNRTGSTSRRSEHANAQMLAPARWSVIATDQKQGAGLCNSNVSTLYHLPVVSKQPRESPARFSNLSNNYMRVHGLFS